MSPEPAARQAYLYAIGIDHYESDYYPQLQFCGNDARAISETFQQKIPKIQIQQLISQETSDQHIAHQQVSKMVDEMSRLRLSANDLVLFYFAGHGIAHGGRDYLATSDSLQWGQTTVAIDDVIAAMVNSGAGTTAIIIDACRTVHRSTEEFGYWTRALAQRRGTVVFFGCSPGEVCQEIKLGERGHGLFTFALLTILRAIPYATPIELDRRVGNLVGELVAERKLREQHPYTTVNPLQKASYDLFTGALISGAMPLGEQRECIVIAGPTHAGKSSIGQFLANELNFLHVEMSSFAWQRYERYEAIHDFPGSLQDFMEQVVWGNQEYDIIAKELIDMHTGINRLVVTGPRRVEEIEALRQQAWRITSIYIYANSRMRYRRLTKTSERLLSEKRFGVRSQLNYADFVRSDLREYSWGLAKIPSLPNTHLLINEGKSLEKFRAEVLEHLQSVGIGLPIE